MKKTLRVLRFADNREAPLGCTGCHLMPVCGGDTRAGDSWNCSDTCFNCNPATCTTVCFSKAQDFAYSYREVNGFGISDIGGLEQSGLSLPKYIPLIQHGYITGPATPLAWAAVSLGTVAEALHLASGTDGAMAATPAALRSRLGLASHTKIILIGIGDDETIERFWAVRREGDAATLLSSLGLSCAVPPNFSLAVDEPRPTHLHNRRRSLICANEWFAKGIPTIPVIQALTPHDWEIYEEFLRERPGITTVAAEFQTGLRANAPAKEMLRWFARLERRLGRPLHLLSIGGGHHRRLLREHASGFTIVDSAPFMKSINRRRFRGLGRRTDRWEHLPEANPAELLVENVHGWAEDLAST